MALTITEMIDAEFAGRKLNSGQAEKLEMLLQAEGGSVLQRLCLLSYYQTRRYKLLEDKQINTKFLDHIRWLIDNAPASAAAGRAATWIDKILHASDYELCKGWWMAKVTQDPSNPDIAINAAKFLKRWEPDLSIELVDRALAMETIDQEQISAAINLVLDAHKNPLGQSGDKLLLKASSLYDAFSEEYTLKDLQIIVRMAQLFAEIADFENSSRYAEILLRDSDPFAKHIGHTVMGLTELAAGNYPQAKIHLQVCLSSRSGLMRVAEPSMKLSTALTRKGYRIEVLKYFCKCFLMFPERRIEILFKAIQLLFSESNDAS